MEEKTLHIKGYNGRHIVNHFYYHSSHTNKLAVMFPGLIYTNDKPVLFYTKAILFNAGYDILDIEFDYLKNKDFLFLSHYRKEIVFEDDIEGIFKEIKKLTKYTEFILNAKSMGSKAIIQFNRNISFRKTKIIWHTPPLKDENIFKEMLLCKYKSLAIVGNLDSHYDPEIIRKLMQNKNFEFYEIDKVDHMYMDKYSVFESIEKVKLIIKKIEDFIYS